MIGKWTYVPLVAAVCACALSIQRAFADETATPAEDRKIALTSDLSEPALVRTVTVTGRPGGSAIVLPREPFLFAGAATPNLPGMTRSPRANRVPGLPELFVIKEDAGG